MEENKNKQEVAKEIAQEGAKLAGKAVKGTAKAAGKVAKAGLAAGGTAAASSILTPIITGAVALIALGGVIFGVTKFFHRDPLAIEKTANVVEEVKKIGEFTTACYYEEIALNDSYEDSATFMGRKASDVAGKATKKIGLGFASKFASKATAAATTSHNEIVLIGKGRVRAGFDLSKIEEGDINVHGDTLELVLPPAEVFEIIMNPSDFTTEYEKGTWSHELTKPIKEQAKIELEQNAIEYGILAKAEESGLKRLEDLFRTFGFNTILLTVDHPTEAEEVESITEETATTEVAVDTAA